MPGRILLINPNQMKPGVAPIALDYLAQALEGRGHEVELLDLCFLGNIEPALDEYLLGSRFHAIGLTIRNTDDCYYLSQDFFLPRYKELVHQIRARTQAPIVVGGFGFSLVPERTLEYLQLDFGIIGEGEEALPTLLDRLVAGEDFSHIPGLVYRARGGFRRNPSLSLNLAALDLCARKWVDNIRYFQEGGMGNIETKRGCDKACIYCADPIAKGRKIRMRPPKAVVDELEILLGRGINYLHLCDSEFNLPEEHARAVCQEIIDRRIGGKLHWYAYLSPKPFSRDLALLMKEAGCQGIDFGVDSGNEYMLKMLGRDFTPQGLRQTANICRECDITFMYDLLLGGPGETKETIRETIWLMKESNPSRVGVSLGVRIYPGTKLARMVREEGELEKNHNLQGEVRNNNDIFAPIFYLSKEIGSDPLEFLRKLIGGDERFFLGSGDEIDRNYNYNNNSILVQAIQEGYRGAFWDILRRLNEVQ